VLGTAHAAGNAGSSVQWGDVPTWLLAAIALAALVAAVLAYLKQADAARDVSEQVRLQRHALADQQEANAKQAEVLDAQLREMRQRESLIERQQADEVKFTATRWSDQVPGLRESQGPPLHMARAENKWHRPITNLVCRIQTTPGDLMHEAWLTARMVWSAGGPGLPSYWMFRDEAQGTRVSLVRAGEAGAFIFMYEIAQYPDAQMTLRFTDDAGLHWQINHDEHLEKLDSRDDW
jgi:hypothetical protein